MKRFGLSTVSAALVVAVCVPAIATGHVQRSATSRLTPARSIVGIWTDFVPVAVTVSDAATGDTGCPVGFGGVIKEKFTFQIVAGPKANQVVVHELQPLAGKVTLTKPCAAAAQTPSEQVQTLTTIADFARPYAMHGTISSNRLTLTGTVYGQIETVGTFSFTSDLMSGTMSLKMPFEGAIFSATTALHAVKLTRKR